MPDPWLRPEWTATPGATIVFAHGAVVNGLEMALLRHRLGQLGYRTRQFRYHSMLVGIEENTRRLAQFVAETEGETVHVIGHSMGGVLIRRAFEQTPDPRPGRLIAIGSPLLDLWIGHRVSGLHHRAYCLLGRTAHDHTRSQVDPVWRGKRDFGVIAGTYPFGIGAIFRNLPEPSDGVVLWDETRLGGITDHVTYRLNHFGMLLSRRCTVQMACFLATGKFLHQETAEASAPPPLS